MTRCSRVRWHPSAETSGCALDNTLLRSRARRVKHNVRIAGSLHLEHASGDDRVGGGVLAEVVRLVLQSNHADLPGSLGRELRHLDRAGPWRLGRMLAGIFIMAMALSVVGLQILSLGLITELITSHHEERTSDRERADALVEEILS